MNEASSKFVDNLATEKLIKDKLMKVRHSMTNSDFIHQNIMLKDAIKEFDTIRIEEGEKLQKKYYIIPSGIMLPFYEENNNIYLYYHPCNNPSCNILITHGLYDDNMGNYDFLIKLLNDLNFDVYFMTLPYHFDRTPKSSKFSGEYYLSADLYRSANGFKQAVSDLDASLKFISKRNSLPQIVCGFSMGGCVLLRYYILKNGELNAFLINPVVNLSVLMRENPLFAFIRRDLEDFGDFEIIKKIFKELDPEANLNNCKNYSRLGIAYGVYDQVISEESYEKFVKDTECENVFSYMSGHLNILRVPKLSKDIMVYYEKVLSLVV